MVKPSLGWKIALAGATASSLALALAAILLAGAIHADPGVLYVAPGGNCGSASPCYASVQAAIDAAAEGDVVKVAARVYTGVNNYGGSAQVAYVTKTLTIRGGYAITNWAAAYPATQPTTLDAQGQGRVLYITGNISPTVEGLRITGGSAGAGGGIYVYAATATLVGNTVYSNAASSGGGGVYLERSSSTLTANTVLSNTTSSGGGGGLHLYQSPATLAGNVVVGNIATGAGGGGGVMLYQSSATLTDNVISGNISRNSAGGGLYLLQNSATLTGNTISNNDGLAGGGLATYASSATFTRNTISGNAGGMRGGGMSLLYSPVSFQGDVVTGNAAGQGGGLEVYNSGAMLSNVVIADNQAGSLGSGLYVRNDTSRLLHVTIARNSGGDGSGIYATDFSGAYSSLALTNTILVSHTTGVVATSGSAVRLSGVLWFGNTANGGGTGAITVTNAITGDPAFAPDGYHVTSGSAAIDRGVNAGVTTDVDGGSRPTGSAPDLGADEAAPVAGVAMGGPSSGSLYTSLAFAATAHPATATTPVTYTWQATGQPAVVHAGGLSDTVHFTWTALGAQVITVTASNRWGAAAGTHVVTIVDADQDGDGIPDDVEGTGDPDGDGIPNYLDPDSDGDGIPDSVEGASDADGDGIPNYLDADSDDDGLPDSVEGIGDADHDGLPNYLDPDSDGDGIPDSVEGMNDADGDGLPNYLDPDSDGDGIPDSVEGIDDADHDGIPNCLDPDSDGDGIPDSVEGAGDVDTEGLPNYLDSDSDGDGIADSVEGTGDADQDGIPNYLDGDSDGDGIPDDVEGTGDADGDGIPNYLDDDSDNDGIPDSVECPGGVSCPDADHDGIPDYLDSINSTGLSSLSVSGPFAGFVNMDYAFTSAVSPITAAVPVTYTWLASGQPAIVHVGGLSDTIHLTWLSAGAQVITITARNPWNAVTGTHVLSVELRRLYLPLALRNYPPTRPDAPDVCFGVELAEQDHVSGSFEHENDNDWYFFPAQAGVTYRIETGDLGPRGDTVLELHGTSCSPLLTQNDDIHYPDIVASRIIWTAPTTGRYHVDVRPYDWRVFGPDTQYTLLIEPWTSQAAEPPLPAGPTSDKPPVPATPAPIP